MKKEKAGWGRWLYLLLAVLNIADLWERAGRYIDVTESGAFSPEALADYQAGQWMVGLSSAFCALMGIYVFLTWRLDREERPARRADAIALSLVALVWAALPLLIPFVRLDLLDRALWAFILLVVAGGGMYSWWKLWKDKQKEEIGGDLT